MQDNIIGPPQSGHGECVISEEGRDNMGSAPLQARPVPLSQTPEVKYQPTMGSIVDSLRANKHIGRDLIQWLAPI